MLESCEARKKKKDIQNLQVNLTVVSETKNKFQ